MASIKESIESAIAYLTDHPEEANYTDSEVVATVVDGLRMMVTDRDGRTIETDMTTGIGGTNAAPSPGWLLRAALAACDATLIAMRAAQLGVELRTLEVRVDSVSNGRGILGIDDAVPAGPLSIRARVRIGAKDADPRVVNELVEWAVAHCPVCDTAKREVPVELEVTVV